MHDMFLTDNFYGIKSPNSETTNVKITKKNINSENNIPNNLVKLEENRSMYSKMACKDRQKSVKAYNVVK